MHKIYLYLCKSIAPTICRLPLLVEIWSLLRSLGFYFLNFSAPSSRYKPLLCLSGVQERVDLRETEASLGQQRRPQTGLTCRRQPGSRCEKGHAHHDANMYAVNGDKRVVPSSSPAGGDISPVPVRSSSTLPTPQPGSAPATPTNTSSKTSSSPADGEEEQRGDLILFYNSVYIKQMRHFALRYAAAVRLAIHLHEPLWRSDITLSRKSLLQEAAVMSQE